MSDLTRDDWVRYIVSVGMAWSRLGIRLYHPQMDARPDVQTEYDLASLGEVESIHGPDCDPPRWMMSYKGKVSAKKGDLIQPRG
jgi:hypothetical protein